METKITTVLFEGQIAPNEISAFRGAIMKMFPDENIYHNHEDKGFRYAYPQIQYKILEGKAAIVGVGEGAESLEKHWKTGDICQICIHDEARELKVEGKYTHYFSPVKGSYRYSITQWIALNQANYKTYKSAQSITEQAFLLERTLKGNILSLYKGLGIWLEEELVATIASIQKTRNIRYKHNELISFDITIHTNFPLPVNCGLGKGVSKGYGTIETTK